MKLLKKPICIFLIIIIAFIDIKIIVDYEVIRPTEKYNIVEHKKTVAQVIDFDNVFPEEVVEEETVEETQLEIEEKEETQDELKETETNKENIEELSNALSNETTTEVKEEQPQETTEPEQPQVAPVESPASNSGDIVSTAKQYLGYNYVSGGSSPETGFDCSGFTKYIYGQFGINLNRVAADQAANGTPISKEELQPGDLVLFSYYGSSSIGHSGIYIGDGQFIHAANSKRGVVTDTLESGYYLDNYVTARRVN